MSRPTIHLLKCANSPVSPAAAVPLPYDRWSQSPYRHISQFQIHYLIRSYFKPQRLNKLLTWINYLNYLRQDELPTVLSLLSTLPPCIHRPPRSNGEQDRHTDARVQFLSRNAVICAWSTRERLITILSFPFTNCLNACYSWSLLLRPPALT